MLWNVTTCNWNSLPPLPCSFPTEWSVCSLMAFWLVMLSGTLSCSTFWPEIRWTLCRTYCSSTTCWHTLHSASFTSSWPWAPFQPSTGTAQRWEHPFKGKLHPESFTKWLLFLLTFKLEWISLRYRLPSGVSSHSILWRSPRSVSFCFFRGFNKTMCSSALILAYFFPLLCSIFLSTGSVSKPTDD